VFYPELFAGDPELEAQAHALAERLYEFSEFLVRVLGVEEVGAVYEGKVAYHASCHLLRELGVDEPPHRLLQGVRGIQVTPMDLEAQCCGFGGTFAVKYPDISDAMLKKKIDSLKRAGADTLVSCDAGCLMHIAGRLHRQGDAIRVMHLAELLSTQSAVPKAGPKEDASGASGN
jgi:L-lactate dehydrogenase complex protein LldE